MGAFAHRHRVPMFNAPELHQADLIRPTSGVAELRSLASSNMSRQFANSWNPYGTVGSARRGKSV
jgi:hypothetical protein